METKITINNQINSLRQQLENDYVARMNAQLQIADAQSVPDDAPKQAKDALQSVADNAKIQLVLIEQRIKNREPMLEDLEKKQKAAQQ